MEGQRSDAAADEAAEESNIIDLSASLEYRNAFVNRIWVGLAGWSSPEEEDPSMTTGGGVPGATTTTATPGTGTVFGTVELRRSIARERFSAVFSTLKTTTYQDPGSRGPSSHSIRSIAWSPTGRYVATGSADRTLRVWNPERPAVKNSTELKGHTGAVERVLFNPTKEAELASCSADGTVRIWDVRSKSCRAEVKLGGEGFTLAWSPDGKTIIAGRKDDTLIPISLEGKLLANSPPIIPDAPLPQSVQTNEIIFSNSGEHLLLTTGFGTIKIVKYPSFETVQTITAHTSACLSLELDSRGKHLVVGGSDALLSIWETNHWFCRSTMSEFLGPVRSVSMTFDGSYVCGGCDEGTGIDIGHVESGEIIHHLPTTHPAPCVAWHPHRYWLAYSGDPMGLNIVGPNVAAGSN
ncbi:MAG: hypothetical protein M1823_001747 [Watsoniomyces obsoletus]|nr:MAG: hypothetical protein M1823_001747 [Watsoniomyces obsoletus]